MKPKYIFWSLVARELPLPEGNLYQNLPFLLDKARACRKLKLNMYSYVIWGYVKCNAGLRLF